MPRTFVFGLSEAEADGAMEVTFRRARAIIVSPHFLTKEPHSQYQRGNGDANYTFSFPGAIAVSGTRIGSRDARISERRFSNHGGTCSLLPSSSLVSSFSNDPGALQQLSTRIPPGQRQYIE